MPVSARPADTASPNAAGSGSTRGPTVAKTATVVAIPTAATAAADDPSTRHATGRGGRATRALAIESVAIMDRKKGLGDYLRAHVCRKRTVSEASAAS